MDDTTQLQDNDTQQESQPKWRPIGRRERRVLGVLVEKAKTTPDAYPLTLNALTNGCKQKSNRDPQMNLTTEQVEEALENLRNLMAVVEVQSSSRVAKFRHLMYEWLGVNKVEAAVMTELLLRGPQTLGELRGRAARMEPIADVNALKPIVEGLSERGLVLSLTPPGRGQIVTHTLFLPDEMEKVRRNASSMGEAQAASPGRPAASATAGTPASASAPPENQLIAQLRRELDELKSEVHRLKNDVADLWKNLS